MLKIFYFLIFLGLLAPLGALVSDDPKALLNWCLSAKNHKPEPSFEDSLHNQCSPWANRSCCNVQTSVDVHYSNMYHFDYNHCKHVSPMSDKCRKHFIQDLCFYECSPNIGPWVVKINQKIRKERFMDVPLCANDCESWFEDCADDYTCTNNWARNFDWVRSPNGGSPPENRCPVGSTCKRFRDIFKTAQYFCENIWDHSWKFTPNEEPCMRLWFDAKSNPNDKVTQIYIDKLMDNLGDASSANNMTCSYIFLIFLIFFHNRISLDEFN